jgi:hypothetical protein
MNVGGAALAILNFALLLLRSPVNKRILAQLVFDDPLT